MIQPLNSASIFESSILMGTLIGVPATIGGILAYGTIKEVRKSKRRVKGTRRKRITFAQGLLKSAKKLKSNIFELSILSALASVSFAILIDINRKKPLKHQKIEVPKVAKKPFSKNQSRIFSQSDERLKPHFTDKGVFDSFHFFFGIWEQDFKNKSLKERICFLNSKVSPDGKTFFDCVDASEEEKRFWSDITKILTLEDIFNGKKLKSEDIRAINTLQERMHQILFQNGSRFKMEDLTDLSTYISEVENTPLARGKKSITICCGASIQELMALAPEFFENSVQQSASRPSTFEGGMDWLIYHLLCGYQPHAVQGETLATMLFYASVYRKYIFEQLLADVTNKQQCLNLDPGMLSELKLIDEDAINDALLRQMKIGLQMPSEIAFCAPDPDQPINDDRKDDCLKTKPLIPVAPEKKLPKVGQLISFAIDLGHNQARVAANPKSSQIAKDVLELQTTGGIAICDKYGFKTLFMTGLGMGAFKNKEEDFLAAEKEAFELLKKTKNLDHIVLVVYNHNDKSGDIDHKRTTRTEKLAQSLEIDVQVLNLNSDKEKNSVFDANVNALKQRFTRTEPVAPPALASP